MSTIARQEDFTDGMKIHTIRPFRGLVPQNLLFSLTEVVQNKFDQDQQAAKMCQVVQIEIRKALGMVGIVDFHAPGREKQKGEMNKRLEKPGFVETA